MSSKDLHGSPFLEVLASWILLFWLCAGYLFTFALFSGRLDELKVQGVYAWTRILEFKRRVTDRVASYRGSSQAANVPPSAIGKITIEDEPVNTGASTTLA